MSKVMLCADTPSVHYPECLGLEGEQLFAQDWLRVLSNAQEVRSSAQSLHPDEIWVAGSDDVDAINLAATLKHDGAAGKVYLLAFKGNGSLLSRARAASIDDVWDKTTFLEQYRKEKSAHSTSHVLNAAVQANQLENRTHVQVLENTPVKKQAPPSGQGYLLSVVGAGGGVGKSSVSVIAAYVAQSKGYRTVLFDADLQFGDIAYLTGREDTLPLDEALASRAKFESLDCEGRQPAVLSAPLRLEHSEEIAGKVPELIEELRTRFDVVVVNTSPAWADIHLQLLEAGGNTLFLIDQRPSSIRACKHALGLCARCGVATQPIVFALNRCSRQSLFSSIDVTCALKGAHVVEFAEGGRDVEELLGTGAPIELVDSGNALCQSIARVLADLLPAASSQKSTPLVMPSRKRFGFGMRRKKAACL